MEISIPFEIAYKKGLPDAAKIIYGTIKAFKEMYGVTPTADEMSKLTNQTIGNFYKHLRVLRAAGLIESTRHKQLEGRLARNNYRLLDPSAELEAEEKNTLPVLAENE